MLPIIIAITISYLIGSIPTAYIFGRILKGQDIRRFGSGNVGATNAFRFLGKVPGMLVLLLDIGKGFLAIAALGSFCVVRSHLVSNEICLILIGIACIAGHNWTVFLGFKGGKGVATTLGVLLGLSIAIPGLRWILVLLLATWLGIFLVSGIVSLASVISAISLPIYIWLFKQSLALTLTGTLLSFFVLIRHKANIVRLFQGREFRLRC